MAIDLDRTLRGALAGAVAAGVWALQQPLDKRLLRSGYDDTELLGRALTSGPAWPVAGTALHLANGAAFGALYANVAPVIPLPAWARGPAAAMAENFVLWPLVAVTDRFHPARDELPKLVGNRAAFAQSAWRHLVFGFVLGELERRLNPPQDEEIPPYEHVASQNGHGDLAAAAGIGNTAT